MYAETVECMSCAGSVCWSLSYVVKFIADGHGSYESMEDYGVSNAEYLVHLVHMNRLSACREFCGVYM